MTMNAAAPEEYNPFRDEQLGGVSGSLVCVCVRVCVRVRVYGRMDACVCAYTCVHDRVYLLAHIA
jgi:hypothetical protein